MYKKCINLSEIADDDASMLRKLQHKLFLLIYMNLLDIIIFFIFQIDNERKMITKLIKELTL